MIARVNFLPDERSHEATRLLPYVMAVMVYLSALALMGSMVLHRSFSEWTEALSNRLTIQITTPDPALREAETADVTRLLQQTPGIDFIHRLNKVEIENLLEPWLGEGNVTSDLPLPVMIDVTVSRTMAVNLDALRGMMAGISENIHLDDHQQWLGRFVKLMDAVEYTALGVLSLVVMATVCIVIFGTKAGMAENRETISIMHHLGAEDSMIARAFQRRFMRYGLKGGAIGLVLAFITLVSLMSLSRAMMAGLVRLPDMPVAEGAVLLVIPLLAALLCMVTARITVMRGLNRMV